MLRGNPFVSQVFACAFPSREVLSRILEEADDGAFVFTHHPIDMRCGSPRSKLPGKGFIPLPEDILMELVERRFSVYSCHAPLDIHPTVSTSGAIVKALGGEPTGGFLEYGDGYAGIYCTIPAISYNALLDTLCSLFKVPYLDLGGEGPQIIKKLAVVAGGGDRAPTMQEASDHGVDAYITGHIRHYTSSPVYEKRRREVDQWLQTARMYCIGVSHAASEYLVMKTQVPQLFQEYFGLEVIPMAEDTWWR